MTQKQKLIDSFLLNPCSLRFPQLVKVLEHYGCVRVQAKGSHVKFKHKSMVRDLIIPVHKGTCEDFYKKTARDFITEINNR